ncbi:MAG: DMT family transporter [Spirochaetales bacterium]|nr:DMT family transporter [Spirochaetales bacterium]
MKLNTARLYVLLSALLWSSGGLIAKIVSLRPLSVTFFRGVTGLLALVIYILLLKGRKKHPLSPLKKGKKYLLIFLGALCYGGTSIFLFLALRMTTAANATILMHTTPIWVALLGFLFLGERARPRDWLALAVILFGIALCMKGDFSFTGHLGNALALASGLAFSVLVLIMRYLDEGSSLAALAWGTFLAILISSPAFAADLREGSLSARDVLLTLGMGIFQFALPFVLYNRALPWMKAVESTILRLLEPVLVPIWVALLVGEIPGWNTLVGGGIVLTVLVLLVAVPVKGDRRITPA